MTSMALAMRGRGDRQARSLRLGAVAGIAAGLAALLTVALISSRTSSGPDLASRQSAVTTWEDTVHPLLTNGGQVVALGPRTAVAALTQQTMTDAEMHGKATGWVRRLSELRAQIAAVQPPASLRKAHALRDTAMAGYVTASRDLLDATAATGARRTQLLSDAAAAGKAADHNYDLA